MQQHASFVADSLRPGASAAAVLEAEAALGVKLPHVLVAILRVHDGQSLGFDTAFDRYVSWRMMNEEEQQPPQQQQQQQQQQQGDAPPQPPRWHPSMVRCDWCVCVGGWVLGDSTSIVLLWVPCLLLTRLAQCVHVRAPRCGACLVAIASTTTSLP